jgi:hypothetical protein
VSVVGDSRVSGCPTAGLDHTSKVITITPLDASMTSSSRAIKDSTRTRPAFDIAYDKLVVAVGAENNTFGTPGVYEHAHFLKEVPYSSQFSIYTLGSTIYNMLFHFISNLQQKPA